MKRSKTTMQPVNQRVKNVISRLRISPKLLAAEFGVTKQSVYRMLNGHVKKLRGSNLTKLIELEGRIESSQSNKFEASLNVKKEAYVPDEFIEETFELILSNGILDKKLERIVQNVFSQCSQVDRVRIAKDICTCSLRNKETVSAKSMAWIKSNF